MRESFEWKLFIEKKNICCFLLRKKRILLVFILCVIVLIWYFLENFWNEMLIYMLVVRKFVLWLYGIMNFKFVFFNFLYDVVIGNI